MTSARDYKSYVEDILETIARVESFTHGQTQDSFEANDEKVFAVIRGLEIVGEAAKNIPDGLRREYPNIPWRQMAGMRDVLIHQYFGTDSERVWTTATRDLPSLRPELERMLSDLRSLE